MGGVRSGVDNASCSFLEGYRTEGGTADLESAIAEVTRLNQPQGYRGRY